jgi:GNAT superfamily N-acetyltransferase
VTNMEIQAVVGGDQREEAWKLYLQSFDELRYLAVQRHVMYGAEFDAVMADQLVDKFLLWGDDGSLQGLSTMTAHLRSMPLVSPEYFERRWPERYAAGLVFYIGFLGVHPDSHGTGVFGDLVRAMTESVARREGLAVIDVCTYNNDKLHLPRAIRWLASTWASHVEMADIDAQTYVGYDFARAG